MSEFAFAPATRRKAKARVALAGPSGSGKTWTALTTATALGNRVAVIDTERGSASKYAGDFTFDVLEMHDYDPRNLVKALAAAGRIGYDVVLVDSLSHFWMGSGGLLEVVDHAAKRSYGGNTFGGWKEARPIERQMVDALLAYPGHVIVTMRTKTEWVLEENTRGRKEPKRIGTKPEQREGIEYEFDVVGDMDLEHTLTVSKSRCRALADSVVRTPDESFGAAILDWLEEGSDAGPTIAQYLEQAVDKDATYDELVALGKELKRIGKIGAPVVDETGEETTLEQLLRRRCRETKPARGDAA